MTANPRKPLLVNLTWAVVLALALYCAAFISTYALDGFGTLNPATVARLDETVFRPITLYRDSDLPGAYEFAVMCRGIYDWAKADEPSGSQ